jgi:hypothetical protein
LLWLLKQMPLTATCGQMQQDQQQWQFCKAAMVRAPLPDPLQLQPLGQHPQAQQNQQARQLI